MNTNPKKILIITYYWPPSGASGVQRWLKFVKYLPEFGWKPFVFTPKNPVFQITDPSLARDIPPEAEVIHYPIWEPDRFFFRLTGAFGKGARKPKDVVGKGRQSVMSRLITWIRATFFIPDPRICWVRPSVKFLSRYLEQHNIPVIVTTGPPHSMHLIGLALKKKHPALKWVADFRDPWSEWGLLDDLNVSASVRAKHERLEHEVLTFADEVMATAPSAQKKLAEIGGRKVQLLTNGYDTADFSGLKISRGEHFTICHVGVMDERRNPKTFLKAVASMMREDPRFAAKVRIEFIGDVHRSFPAFVSSDPVLSKVVSFTGNVPHRELIALYGRASLLLLVLSDFRNAGSYIPGKIFEYLATGLPILGLGPEDADAAFFLNETGAGNMIAYNNEEGVRSCIAKEFEAWHAGTSRNATPRTEQWSRKNLTGELAVLLERLL